MEVSKPRVIISARHGLCIGTMAQAQPTSPTAQERPAIDAEVLRKAELLQIELLRPCEISHRQNEGGCKYVEHLQKAFRRQPT